MVTGAPKHEIQCVLIGIASGVKPSKHYQNPLYGGNGPTKSR